VCITARNPSATWPTSSDGTGQGINLAPHRPGGNRAAGSAGGPAEQGQPREIVRAFRRSLPDATLLGGYLARREWRPEGNGATYACSTPTTAPAATSAPWAVSFRVASPQSEEETRSLFPDPGWRGRLAGLGGARPARERTTPRSERSLETLTACLKLRVNPIGMTSAAGHAGPGERPTW